MGHKHGKPQRGGKTDTVIAAEASVNVKLTILARGIALTIIAMVTAASLRLAVMPDTGEACTCSEAAVCTL
ncbi:hypothetical protein AYO38_02605 [bacterium SCGC AG-212-C10]|nr:hypothetical protein AYO38_02605 [bacterium SCGC AG-212-C10]